ncbi:MAG: hypothetical protein ACREIB_07530, partial [Pseudomonadota bacterium]
MPADPTVSEFRDLTVSEFKEPTAAAFEPPKRGVVQDVAAGVATSLRNLGQGVIDMFLKGGTAITFAESPHQREALAAETPQLPAAPAPETRAGRIAETVTDIGMFVAPFVGPISRAVRVGRAVTGPGKVPIGKAVAPESLLSPETPPQ